MAHARRPVQNEQAQNVLNSSVTHASCRTHHSVVYLCDSHDTACMPSLSIHVRQRPLQGQPVCTLRAVQEGVPCDTNAGLILVNKVFIGQR
jgi:hypothetical protein